MELTYEDLKLWTPASTTVCPTSLELTYEDLKLRPPVAGLAPAYMSLELTYEDLKLAQLYGVDAGA